MTVSRSVTVAIASGIHARPAALFVEKARTFIADLSLEHGERKGNCKSLISMLKLGVPHGAEVSLTASGDDEEIALTTLVDFLGSAGDDQG
jgi:phosphotransferase system HPr (HPr) family protein